jgi:hypothetical protein
VKRERERYEIELMKNRKKNETKEFKEKKNIPLDKFN